MTHETRIQHLDRARMYRRFASIFRARGMKELARANYIMALHQVMRARIVTVTSSEAQDAIHRIAWDAERHYQE